MTIADAGEWAESDASGALRHPTVDDDKYSRGVLGFVTGSRAYPGAAVLGVEAALHTGLGMVRYIGPDAVADLVLARRPETVTHNGRVQAWVLGSGMERHHADPESEERLGRALSSGVPCILDAGALHLFGSSSGPVLLTPHAGELASLVGVDRASITEHPLRWCRTAADRFGVTVLLKGSSSYVASPQGIALKTQPATAWLATAGTGDALAGIAGAIVAGNADRIAADPSCLAESAATAVMVHSAAALRASGGGPFTVLALIERIPEVVAQLLAGRLSNRQ